MSMHITQQHAKQALTRFDALKKRIEGMKEKAEHTTQKVVRTVEVGGAAFGMGLLQGYTGGVEVFGVPLELGLGIGLNVFGLLGGAGAYSDHLHNVADGCLASYATTLGRGVGTTMLQKSEKPKELPAAVKGTRLTQEEVAEMAGIPA